MGVDRRDDIVEAIYKASEREAGPARPHLGGSEIGGECERQTWYKFRWYKQPSFNGRMMLLFQRGHEEEPRLVKGLQDAGWQVEDVDPETLDQWHVEMFPHFSGSLDGIGYYNGESYLLEFKTHNDKSFKKLEKQGVAQAKPQHFAQMQTYMGAFGLNKALYMAVNKNDDALYIEIIDFNRDVYDGIINKAERIIHGYGIPPQSYELEARMSPCKFCDFKNICHGIEKPDINCRTCKYSEPTRDGKWKCHKYNTEIPLDEQRKGCKLYEAREEK